VGAVVAVVLRADSSAISNVFLDAPPGRSSFSAIEVFLRAG
jgi:hypothetical protein